MINYDNDDDAVSIILPIPSRYCNGEEWVSACDKILRIPNISMEIEKMAWQIYEDDMVVSKIE